MSNFWQKLDKPFLVLAPMEDVTDYVFREIVTFLPKPAVFFTEFVSSDALCSKGREATISKLKYSERQRPIVAQIWGSDPDKMEKAASIVKELGFDGVDINMGCPVDAVMKKGAGAAHIKNPALTKEIIKAVKRGADGLPVSIKTRIGIDKIVTVEWIGFLLKQNLAALTVHGRTAEQMSKGEANWDEIGKAVKLRDEISPSTLLIGNGSIKSKNEALLMSEKHKVAGVMIASGIFSNPWIFEAENEHSREEYIEVLQKHLQLFEDTWGKTKNFEIMKKFFKMYIKGFDGANQLRQRLMETKSRKEALQIIENI